MPATATATFQQIRLGRITKSASLDHDIVLSSRRFKPKHTECQQNRPRSLSATSTAGYSFLTNNNSTSLIYQEYKMEIINQGKCLCGHYIRARLRRSGILNRKVIQRLKAVLDPSSDVVYNVFPVLNTMGEELERMHPHLYTNVSRQISRAPFGELDVDTSILLNLVAKNLFQNHNTITWGKIASIFAVCAGLAIDSVKSGQYEFLQFLVDGIAEIIEDDLVPWLIDQGGWPGLQEHVRPQFGGQFSFLGWLTLFVTISSSAYVLSSFCKNVGCHLYSLIF